jgi:hypothetical protein
LILFDDEIRIGKVMLSCVCNVRGLKYLLEATLLDTSFNLVKVFKIVFRLDDGLENVFLVDLIANGVVPDNCFQVDGQPRNQRTVPIYIEMNLILILALYEIQASIHFTGGVFRDEGLNL